MKKFFLILLLTISIKSHSNIITSGPKLKVYVAAKFSDKERVKSIYKLLKEKGHTITHEWVHNKPSFPFTDDINFATQCSQEDINAVLQSDIFILLSNSEPSTGASSELGAAIASNIMYKKPQVYVVGPHLNANIFFYHPSVIIKESFDDVLKDINNFSESQ